MIEVELDKYHLVASLLTVADACSQHWNPEVKSMGNPIEEIARNLWVELPQHYRHSVELEVKG